MFRDRYDRTLWGGLLLGLIGLLLVLGRGGDDAASPGTSAVGRAMEREMAAQAKHALLQKLYGPVEELRREGRLQNALLKLDELERSYPGEAHGHILKGDILTGLGALDRAVASYAAGVRLSGDYIDQRSSFNRRTEIARVVAQALPEIAAAAGANPSNRSLADALSAVRYLQSRLAGGCE